MRTRVRNLARAAALVAVAALVAAGCGGAATVSNVGGGSIAQNFDFSGHTYTVGSKEFTEQEILGNMTILALRAAGAQASSELGISGSTAVRQALTSSEIDMYWEYIGTAWISFLGHTGSIPEPQFQTVAEEDLSENNIKWTAKAPYGNSYAIATNQETAEEYNVETISDIERVVNQHPDQAAICSGFEFSARDDGLPGLQEAYGFEFPSVVQVQDALVYTLVQRGERCNFGSVFTTDGRIPNLNLVLLTDDQNFFPAYNPGLTMRQEVFQENQQLADLFEPIADTFTLETMQNLNAKVDVQGQRPEDVAEEYLRENGFIG